MRVLVALPAAELYGSDRVARATVQALIGAGHEVLVASSGDGPLLALLTDDGARVERIPVPVLRKQSLHPLGLVRLVVAAVRAVPAARRVLRTFTPDVVLANTVTVPLWSVLARSRRGCRLVVHVHEAEATMPRIAQRLLLLPLLLTHRVVANSRFTLGVLTAVWPRLAARCVVVLNPVPGPPGPPERSRRHIPARLAYVGRISARKGVDVAVAAAGLLHRDGIDVQLGLTGSVFAGNEPFVEDLHRRIAADGLTDVVTFHDFVDDVWPVLAAADIVLMPSVLDESFGNAAVEAVLAARPLVASRQGGVVEATEGYAAVVIVPPADATALAAGIRTVLAEHERYAAAAMVDAAVAARRHAPDAYRSALLAAIGP